MPDPADSRPIRQPHAVVLYKKDRCPLCDEALATLRAVARRTPFNLAVTDITHDPALLAAHGMDVPVVFIDGRKRFFGHVDRTMFERALHAT
jgi:glutaredoxin